MYIKPSVHREFCCSAEVLPDLQASIESEIDFPSAAIAFFQWCGNETEYATWGRGDFKVLKENLNHWGLNGSLPMSYYDLQTAFSATANAKFSVALSSAVEYFKIPTIFTFHNALYDAVYTALIGTYINTVPLQVELLLKEHGKNTEEKGKHQKLGPFNTVEAALNSRSCRHPCCPQCGKVYGLSHWFFENSKDYYARFSCKEHGKFICHLTLFADHNENYWGELSVEEEKQMAYYRTATQAQMFSCKQTNHARKYKAWYHVAQAR